VRDGRGRTGVREVEDGGKGEKGVGRGQEGKGERDIEKGGKGVPTLRSLHFKHCP